MTTTSYDEYLNLDFDKTTIVPFVRFGNSTNPHEELNTIHRLSIFYKEKEAFKSLNESVKREHRGKYIAIYKGEIVAADEDRSKVIEQFYKAHGNEVVYINKVDSTKTVYKIHTRHRKL